MPSCSASSQSSGSTNVQTQRKGVQKASNVKQL
uniref:Uncharacterized protein n=1 Tax=Arundo donax TaxID=35708 RepID=A0A0A8Y1E1_ARUDO